VYLIGLELDSFDTLPIEDRLVVLRRQLHTLAETNCRWLKHNPSTPSLYEWAPRYQIKPRPYVPAIGEQADIWQDIPSTMRRGTADCKDVAAWRVGELYNEGYRVGFHIKVQQIADLIVYHIQVEGFNKDGRFCREDPSKLLGMPTAVTASELSRLMQG
jgi:hypothetical protein